RRFPRVKRLRATQTIVWFAAKTGFKLASGKLRSPGRVVALCGQSLPVLPRRRGWRFATAQDHSAQCWRALPEVSEAKWLPSDGDRPDWVSKGDRSKEDSNEKKMGVRMSDSP